MKQFISAILLFAFVLVNFSKVFIWAHYELNKTQIIKEYCVNKDKPMMHCCGKCHLKKKLAEDDEKQKSPAMPDIKNDIQLFSSYYCIAFWNNENVFFSINSPYSNGYHSGIHASIFHPPCC